jgi:hypothetical protein
MTDNWYDWVRPILAAGEAPSADEWRRMQAWLEFVTSIVLALICIGVLGMFVLAFLFDRRRRLRQTVSEQFESFRKKTVALMDQLDALRQRHETLPSNDPDFKLPMTGATLALYNQVASDLNGLWERWLGVMETWERAQRELKTRRWKLTAKPIEEAQRLLEAGDVDALVRESAVCKERLDRLKQGHELARSSLNAARIELECRRTVMERQTMRGQVEVSDGDQIIAAETMLTAAEEMIEADPIGARETIERTRRSIAGPGETELPDPAKWDDGRHLPTVFEELTGDVNRFRESFASLAQTQATRPVGCGCLILVMGFVMNFFAPLVPFTVFFVLPWVVMIFGAVWILYRTAQAFFRPFVARPRIDGQGH